MSDREEAPIDDGLPGTRLALFTGDLLGLHGGPARERLAVIDGTRRVTYGQLQAQVEALAAHFAGRGATRGDRVVVQLRKSLEEVVAMFACWRLGLVMVNVNSQWTASQLRYVIDDSLARFAVLEPKCAGEIATARPTSLQHAVVTGQPPEGPFAAWPAPGPSAPPCHLLDIDLAAILYTSGSTGSPKGVMLTHANLLVGARSVARYTGQRADDCLLSVLPFSFDYGLNQLLTAFLVGARIVLMPITMPSAIVQMLLAEEVTGFAAVPPIWVQVARYLEQARTSLPKLRYITNSGGPIPTAVLEALPSLLPSVRIHLMYGLTEAFRSTSLHPDRVTQKLGSMGTAVPNVETFVVVPGRGLAKPGEHGELVHRGSFISQGYWGRPEQTEERIRPATELPQLPKHEKVVWSGDIVRADADGDLWFVGRSDAMIKTMGFRLSPTEVEDIVFRSGLATQVVAFGVPDEVAGQVVEICVSHQSGTVDTAAILAHARAHMPHYMVPRRIHVWPAEMPRTASGKIDVPTVVKGCSNRHDVPGG